MMSAAPLLGKLACGWKVAAHVVRMDSFASFAVTRPRDHHGRFAAKSHSAPTIEITRDEMLAATRPCTSCEAAIRSPISPTGEPETLDATLLPNDDGYAGWGRGLWQGTSSGAEVGAAYHTSAALYRQLGNPGVDAFEVFVQLTAMGDSSNLRGGESSIGNSTLRLKGSSTLRSSRGSSSGDRHCPADRFKQ
jgi:hypothetical protein